jgi:hypothetical protein
MFADRTHPDDPISGAALATKGNVDAHGPQEGLRPAKAPGAGGRRVRADCSASRRSFMTHFTRSWTI